MLKSKQRDISSVCTCVYEMLIMIVVPQALYSLLQSFLTERDREDPLKLY